MRNKAEIQERLERREAELQTARYQERVKFREELRTILQEHGKEAGPEIDQLVKRNNFDGDPDRTNQATRIWQQSRYSQAAKVKLIRALDMPESIILNFISDDIYLHLSGTRNGPRTSGQIRIRAAQQLLRLELPPEDAMPQSRQPVDSATGRTARYRATPGQQPVQRHN